MNEVLVTVGYIGNICKKKYFLSYLKKFHKELDISNLLMCISLTCLYVSH